MPKGVGMQRFNKRVESHCKGDASRLWAPVTSPGPLTSATFDLSGICSISHT